MKLKSFREFVSQDNMEEEKDDIKATLAKIPPSHAALIQGYRWKFHPGNTLNGDSQHVGYIDDQDREIAIAAPYNYGREFTVLHEIAHKVWDHIGPDLQKQWIDLYHKTKNKQNQEATEIFCHAYAASYVKHPPVTQYHPEWVKFIKGLPK